MAESGYKGFEAVTWFGLLGPAKLPPTVVSSVNRGPADLSFGGCPVVLTAGYPALSPMMSLTHGAHGIGDVLAISVHADPVNVDVDDYLLRLRSALGLNPRGRA